jgi:tetratricopeptide (TPR) repeat protein
LQLGRYPDALETVDRGEALLEGTLAHAHDLARATYLHAAIVYRMERWTDALRTARRALTLFAMMGDASRVAKCESLEASVLFDRKQYSEALTRWQRVLPIFEDHEDRRTVALVSMNIGACQAELGHLAAARTSLEGAIEIFRQLRDRSETNRARYVLASLEALHGADRAAGIEALWRAHREYERMGMHTDAAFVALDIAEAYLRPPSNASLAASACVGAAELLERAGATESARKAVEYLRNSLRAQSAESNVRILRQVRTHLRAVERDPDLSFGPEEVA